MKMNWLRNVFSIVFLITLSACALAPAPGPEARAAADQLAADIDRKQRQHVGSANRAQPDVKLFARVFERVKAEYVRPVDEDMLIAAASHALADATPPSDLSSDDWYVEQAINGMLARRGCVG